MCPKCVQYIHLIWGRKSPSYLILIISSTNVLFQAGVLFSIENAKVDFPFQSWFRACINEIDWFLTMKIPIIWSWNKEYENYILPMPKTWSAPSITTETSGTPTKTPGAQFQNDAVTYQNWQIWGKISSPNYSRAIAPIYMNQWGHYAWCQCKRHLLSLESSEDLGVQCV